MIQPLITGERGCGALVSFAERVEWLQECTNSPDSLADAFHQLKAGEDKRGRMLDAAYESIERLSKRPNSRRVLLLISESRDRGSDKSLESVAMVAQAAGVTIYAATYSAFKTAFTSKSSNPPALPSKKQPASLSEERGTLQRDDRVPIPPPEQRADLLGAFGELARLGMTNTTEALMTGTGGTAFPFTRQKGLEDAIEKLSRELQTQYVLSFTPEAPVPGYHHLEVRIKRAGDYVIRARPGYWATEQR